MATPEGCPCLTRCKLDFHLGKVESTFSPWGLFRVRKSSAGKVFRAGQSCTDSVRAKKREGDFSRETSPSLFRFSEIRFGFQIATLVVRNPSAPTSYCPQFPRSAMTTLTARAFHCHPFPVAWTESRCRFSEMTVTPLSPSGRSLFR
jgi:hypothetical protein